MVAGLDIGSRTVKAVLMHESKMLAYKVVDTGSSPKKTGEALLDQLLFEQGAKRESLLFVVGTGYGRVSLTVADHTVTELSCHGRGAHFLNADVRTVIDVGGQDSKVIRIDEYGTLQDFSMNDRCAAGTGRFMEGVARALETDLDSLGTMSESARTPCTINSMCAVFAESEVVSLLAQGHEREDVAAGVFEAFAHRVGNLAKGVGIREKVAFVGGAAKNPGLRKALANYLSIELVPLNIDPQIVGALGAAILAEEMQ
jgi:predicted CoA-substrate-specific enzyme activase